MKSKSYTQKEITLQLEEPVAIYASAVGMDFISQDSLDDKRMLKLYNTSNQGVDYHFFKNLYENAPFSSKEWSDFLHLSERSLQRYKKEEKPFDTTQTEKLLEISMLFQKGYAVFGDKNNFHIWLESNNIYLGNKKPKEFLTNTFGINLLKDELIRIENGILA